MKYCFILVVFIFTSLSLHAQYDTTYSESGEGDSDDNSEYSYEEEVTEPQHTYSSKPSELTTTRNHSNEKINVRKFDDTKWRKVVGSTDYSESRPKSKPQNTEDGQSLSDSEKSGKRYRENERDEEEYEDEPASSGNGFSISGPIAKILFYTIIVVLIGTILYFIFRNTSFKANPKTPKAEPSPEEAVEDISELDVDSWLGKTQASGNYRLAIRLYFLGLLKKLNEAGHIAWKKDKTNRDYLTELYAKAIYFQEIRHLTLAYERVWYGDHSVSADVFQQLKEEFKTLDQQLNQTKAL